METATYKDKLLILAGYIGGHGLQEKCKEIWLEKKDYDLVQRELELAIIARNEMMGRLKRINKELTLENYRLSQMPFNF